MLINEYLVDIKQKYRLLDIEKYKFMEIIWNFNVILGTVELPLLMLFESIVISLLYLLPFAHLSFSNLSLSSLYVNALYAGRTYTRMTMVQR